MKENNVTIRLEKESEWRETETLVRDNFWNVYRPGCLEHYVLHQLRKDSAFVPELDLVMELNGRIIGQIVFVKAQIMSDDERRIPILTMGPVCIANDLKRHGYGRLLVNHALGKAEKLGFGAVCIEGNYRFYSECGFSHASDLGLRYSGLPEGADASFFLCRILKDGYLDGVTGVYSTPRGYFVDEAQAKEFDKEFEPREKLKLPGQLVQTD